VARVIPVLHNVSSVQRVTDFARLAYSLGYEAVVVTKAYGGAAQAGVPEAMRIALREGKSLIVLPDLADAVELLSPASVVLVTHDYAEERVEPASLPSLVGDSALIVFSGADPDFSAGELKLATRRVYFEGVSRLGAVAEAALALYYARKGASGG